MVTTLMYRQIGAIDTIIIGDMVPLLVGVFMAVLIMDGDILGMVTVTQITVGDILVMEWEDTLVMDGAIPVTDGDIHTHRCMEVVTT